MPSSESEGKVAAARNVGKLLGVEIIDSTGSTVTRESWTNVLASLYLNGTGVGNKYRKLTKGEAAAAVGAILGVETTTSGGSTVTEDSWKNVLQELKKRHSKS